jgi:hypothetical protein
MTLLLHPTKVQPTEPTRNRVGIRTIFYRAMGKGDRVSLEQAIAILRSGW